MTPRLLLFFVLSLPFAAMSQKKQAAYWQQQVDYAIEVTLNDTAHTLDGVVSMKYINHSPDTLHYIWIHLWPNAYKNDKTAYSEQKLQLRQNDFYFSKPEERGYINRLHFTSDGISLSTEDHPQYIDLIKLKLAKPLLPGATASINTPFHVQIPYRFSRMGYVDQSYNITQWFPKAALYDKNGWHEMPYLEWGEYYSDFGNYDVRITLPANYVVGATGMLQNEAEKQWQKSRTAAVEIAVPKPKKGSLPVKLKAPPTPPSAAQNKTLHYTALNVVDFAWFADKRFIVKYDTVQVGSQTVEVWNYILPQFEKGWKNSIGFTKRAIQFYSNELGNYPYPQVSVVCNELSTGDGMEYPMITSLNSVSPDDAFLDIVITHEVGHNWLEGILASNERDYPWMDEGLNTYYERKYTRKYYIANKKQQKLIDEGNILLNLVMGQHMDQPIDTKAEDLAMGNYVAMPYTKTALWMERLEGLLGKDSMKAAMQNYFQQWHFRHPQPSDMKQCFEAAASKNLDEHFELLHKTGPLTIAAKKDTRIAAVFNLSEPDKHQYISFSPAAGWNNYDKFQLSMAIHNYNIPAHPFQFIVTPLYATGSKQLTGYARAGYTFFPKGKLQKAELYAAAAHFAYEDGLDINQKKIAASFSKLTPGFRLEWKKKNPLSPLRKWADFKTYIIGEQTLIQQAQPAPNDTAFYSSIHKTRTTVIPQLSLGISNERSLYPWDISLAVQQVKQILRSSVEAHYTLQYNAQKAVALRLFAGKIFYTQTKTDQLRAQNSRYHFTMYAPNGIQDYTYSNAFGDRNQSVKLAGRQVMIRDGGFKYRSDFSSVQPGLKTNELDYFDNWLAAANFIIDIPNKVNPLSVLPFEVPLKVFADIGTSASPWSSSSNQPRFLYSFGLQLPLLKCVQIYYPLVQSKAFKEPNSVNDPTKAGGPSWWQKRLTFSLDVNALKPKVAGISLL